MNPANSEEGKKANWCEVTSYSSNKHYYIIQSKTK